MTVTRGEVGGAYKERRGERVFRKNCKGHMDKTKGGWTQGREVGWLGLGGWGENADNCT